MAKIRGVKAGVWWEFSKPYGVRVVEAYVLRAMAKGADMAVLRVILN